MMASGSARIWGVLAVGVIVLAVSDARAGAGVVGDDVVAAQIDELNLSALLHMERKKFDSARKHLLEAERRARERGGPLGDALLAQTFVNLGALEIMAETNAGRSGDYFRRALCRSPKVRPSGSIVERNDIVGKFVRVSSAYSRPPDCPAAQETREPELPARISNGLDCPLPDEVRGGIDLIVRCAASPQLRVTKATLHYHRPRTKGFTVVEMRRSERGWWTASIPAKDLTDTGAMYFVVGESDGRPVVGNGDANSPNVTIVVQACRCD